MYVPLIFSRPADHVPDWQPRILLGMPKVRSVNVRNTHFCCTFIKPYLYCKTADRTGLHGQFSTRRVINWFKPERRVMC